MKIISATLLLAAFISAAVVKSAPLSSNLLEKGAAKAASESSRLEAPLKTTKTELDDLTEFTERLARLRVGRANIASEAEEKLPSAPRYSTRQPGRNPMADMAAAGKRGRNAETPSAQGSHKIFRSFE
ncbi:hypothetical protein NDA11_000774 [Ustilago hordei]|uniref:Uncharacterized protein n=1 Tax=Ustilago hordei TaxID=120017 RepID=I2FZH8_USTHO|nr:uncharacterized protein UHO2_06867 [Ustilago hordei]KAJ1583948.1 hypothetical protein NDA11_000774 [Ustilago hordei]KAJ1599163.1 hypothetical protein NDA14_003233 [Ustilago hordei]CCF52321.1 uncharacterized protein UHOR_15461 [Ustilago hordei]SYW83671.1 uncharacterized protein UHO2_06867 [Ustilago hordei]